MRPWKTHFVAYKESRREKNIPRRWTEITPETVVARRGVTDADAQAASRWQQLSTHLLLRQSSLRGGDEQGRGPWVE